MRKSALALGLALVAALSAHGASAPAAAAAGPKVVIIVGATHGATDRYREYANAEYAEAIKYTSNVVKVYSPNATWSKVKAAVAGASIVIYHGHGNGWPSPYTYDPNYTTKDGFGLNETAGKGDYNNRYYGEPYIDDLAFAPKAVVLLHNLCYAAGNSEPGQPEPSKSVAKQRADNYASAFLKAGAAAVVAGGHESAVYYLGALFTTRQTLDEMWRAAPGFNDNVFSFESVRRPGKTVRMDPDRPDRGFYRSIAGNLETRTEQVTGAHYAATDTHPASFVVPGAAAAGSAGAPIYGDTGQTEVATTLPVGSAVRLASRAGTAADGSALFAVATLDGATTGYARGSTLVPRDSRGPNLWDIDPGGSFSPNGDGSLDEFSVSGRFSETASWRIRFSTDAEDVGEITGSGSTFSAAWAGLVQGAPVPDGRYDWTLEAWDGWGNTPLVETGTVTVDTVAPTIEATSLGLGVPATVFSPNRDGRSDSLAFSATSSEAGTLLATIENSAGSAVARPSASTATGSATLRWDGRNFADTVVNDGLFRVTLAARDAAGNLGPAIDRTIGVYGAVASVLASPAVFHPHDGDARSPYATLSFRLLRPATVTWEVRTLGGTVVVTRYTGEALAAGAYSFRWRGRDADGALLPPGVYVSSVHATNGTVELTQSARVEMNAFAIRVSDASPSPRQRITIYATSAEQLDGLPRVRVDEPALAPYLVTMTSTGDRTYQVTLTLRSGAAGPLRLRVSGSDVDGNAQGTSLALNVG